MKVYNGISRVVPRGRGSVVTVGVFDGVHIGHRRVIGETVRRARARSLASAVVTFDPHPEKVLRPDGVMPSLMSLAHRIRLIQELGVDIVVIVRFTKAFARMSPERFIRTVLARRLGAREIVASAKFFFGRGAAAGVAALRRYAPSCGIAVRVVPSARVDGVVAGSSRVRHLIRQGELARAARCIGRPVSVFGTVVSGSRFGRVLGYPTANINPHHEVVPPSGVYAVTAEVGGRRYGGLLNIGTRPTFFSPRDREPNIEAHLFGFDGSIYGKEIEVFFVRKIRDEAKFAGADALVSQIRRDERAARRILGLRVKKALH